MYHIFGSHFCAIRKEGLWTRQEGSILAHLRASLNVSRHISTRILTKTYICILQEAVLLRIMAATHLAVQDLSKLKVEQLSPLTPEVISRQVCAFTLPMHVLTRFLAGDYQYRNYWARGTWKIDCGESHFGCANCSF